MLKRTTIAALFLSVMLAPGLALATLPGDLDNNGTVDLKDASLALQLSSGMPLTPPVSKAAEVSGDGKIGIEETIYALQSKARLRNNHPPVLSPVGNKTIDEGATLTFSLSATDEDNDPLTFAAAPLPTGATFNPVTRTFSWAPSHSQSGAYQISLSATDPGASTAETITITVSNTNRAPALSAIGNKTTDEKSTLTFSLAASDADGDTLTYAASPLPSGATFTASTRTFSWTPAFSQSGTYPITFSADDGAGGRATETVSVVVNAVWQGQGSQLAGLSGWTASINGTGIEMTGPAEWYRGTVSKNDTTNPKQMDLTFSECFYPAYAGKTALSIYKVENSTLTICRNEPGSTTRPNGFTPTDYTRCFVLTPGIAAPSVPGVVKASASSNSQITVTWAAASDNLGITGYKIFRDGVQAGTSTSTSFLNSGLSSGTNYCYAVKSYDASGNESALSAAACATTSGTAEYTMSEYFPLAQGNSWAYRDNEGYSWTITVSGTATIGGTVAQRYYDSDTSYKLMTSSPAGGISIYKEYDYWDEYVMQYNAPLVVAPAKMTVGARHTFSANGTVTVNSMGTDSLSVSGESMLVGMENVTVAAGTYNNAMKFQLTFVQTALTWGMSCTRNMTLWFAKGIGEVKESHYNSCNDGSPPDSGSEELTWTNLR